jgi:hypothetical protein
MSASSMREAGPVTMHGKSRHLDISLTRAGGLSGTFTEPGVPPVTVIVAGKAGYVLLTPDLLPAWPALRLAARGDAASTSCSRAAR